MHHQPMHSLDIVLTVLTEQVAKWNVKLISMEKTYYSRHLLLLSMITASIAMLDKSFSEKQEKKEENVSILMQMLKQLAED